MWKRNVNSTRRFIPSPQMQHFVQKKQKYPISVCLRCKFSVYLIVPPPRVGQLRHTQPWGSIAAGKIIYFFVGPLLSECRHRASGWHLGVQGRWAEEDTSDLGCVRAEPHPPQAGREETTRSHCSHGAFIVRLALASHPAARVSPSPPPMPAERPQLSPSPAQPSSSPPHTPAWGSTSFPAHPSPPQPPARVSWLAIQDVTRGMYSITSC